MKSIKREILQESWGKLNNQTEVIKLLDTQIWYGVGDPISVDFVHSIMNEVMRQS